jgi:UDP-N-acetylglucosamine 2-epimerase (non-hydrolysing)
VRRRRLVASTTFVCVAGARPNFMKIAPLMARLGRCPGIRTVLVHTGQHYDRAMSNLFFEQLEIPRPDINLEVGSASPAAQLATIVQRFERVLLDERPALVIVVGDVTSTVASALAAVSLGIPVAHVEAGLRSFDRTMPEEINRTLTDAMSDFLFTTERSATHNLLREGVDPSKIHFVGNVMIDTLLAHRRQADQSDVLRQLGVAPRSYALVTLHRPSNVDDRLTLEGILTALRAISRDLPVIFPGHPRTRSRIDAFGLGQYVLPRNGDRVAAGINLYGPFGYLDFLKLMAEAKVVLTDSGGIQEETTVLGTPCVTLRENTERPVTIEQGTNRLAGTSPDQIVEACGAALNDRAGPRRIPELWDGHAAERIVRILADAFTHRTSDETRREPCASV